jgi:hypothetical protein
MFPPGVPELVAHFSQANRAGVSSELRTAEGLVPGCRESRRCGKSDLTIPYTAAAANLCDRQGAACVSGGACDGQLGGGMSAEGGAV